MLPHLALLKPKPLEVPQIGFRNGVCADSGKIQEPKGPKIITDLPGPKTKELIEKLKPFQNISNIELFAHYGKSLGNYLQDVDGNVLLDLNMQSATNSLGYNNAELKRIYQDPKNIHTIINRPVLELFPCDCWPRRIEDILKKISINLPNVSMYSCESTTIENAFKSMMTSFQKHQRNGNIPSLDEVKKALNKTQSSGSSPKLSILSFKTSDHGNTIGALSASNAISSARVKLDVPTFDWPVAHYPSYRYPLEENECYNSFQDKKSLDMVKDLIQNWDKKDLPVVGVVVEPIQSECTQCPSSKFFQNLQQLTNEIGIYLMIDETRTGCGATGKFWCIEHFCLKCPVDVLAFGGKTQISGFFSSEDLISREPCHILDTWMRDPAKLVAFEAIVGVIEKFNLLQNVRNTGHKLKTCLLDMELKNYDLIHSTRGLGTFLAFNAQCPKLRDDIWKRLRKKGILCGKCGEQGITIRPSLIFNENHADIFLDKLEQVIKETALIDSNEKVLPKKSAGPQKCEHPVVVTEKKKPTEEKQKLSICDLPKKSAGPPKCEHPAVVTEKKKPTEEKQKLSICDLPKKSAGPPKCEHPIVVTEKKKPAEEKQKLSICDLPKKSAGPPKCEHPVIVTEKKKPTEEKQKLSICDLPKKCAGPPKCEHPVVVTEQKKPTEEKQKLSICDYSKKNLEKKTVKCETKLAHLNDVPTRIRQMKPGNKCGDVGLTKPTRIEQMKPDKKCGDVDLTKESSKSEGINSEDQCKKKIRKLTECKRNDKKKQVCPKKKTDEITVDEAHGDKKSC